MDTYPFWNKGLLGGEALAIQHITLGLGRTNPYIGRKGLGIQQGTSVWVGWFAQIVMQLKPSLHLLVLATSERKILALVATSDSHWLK